MKNLLTSVSCAIALFAITAIAVFYNARYEIESYSFWGGSNTGLIGRTFFLGTVMLFGIIFGNFYSILKSQEEVKPLSLNMLKNAWRQKALWRSLLASPIVFSVVYAGTKEQPDMVMAALFAFENGFFCEVIFEKRKRP